jgi:hypothetical protein
MRINEWKYQRQNFMEGLEKRDCVGYTCMKTWCDINCIGMEFGKSIVHYVYGTTPQGVTGITSHPTVALCASILLLWLISCKVHQEAKTVL